MEGKEELHLRSEVEGSGKVFTVRVRRNDGPILQMPLFGRRDVKNFAQGSPGSKNRVLVMTGNTQVECIGFRHCSQNLI